MSPAVSHMPKMLPLTDDEKARVAANHGLIAHTITVFGTPYLTGGYTYDDAWQDGYLGLCRAAQKFDPARGAKFSTYAVQWIRVAIQRGKGLYAGRSYRSDHPGSREAVASLDAILTHADRLTIESTLTASDAAQDLDLEAAELIDRLRPLCDGVVDRMIFEALIDPAGPSQQELANRLGVSREWIRRRRLALVGRFRCLLAADREREAAP